MQFFSGASAVCCLVKKEHIPTNTCCHTLQKEFMSQTQYCSTIQIMLQYHCLAVLVEWLRKTFGIELLEPSKTLRTKWLTDEMLRRELALWQESLIYNKGLHTQSSANSFLALNKSCNQTQATLQKKCVCMSKRVVIVNIYMLYRWLCQQHK